MRPRFVFLLSISVVALAMTGTFILIEGHDPVEVSGATSGSCGTNVSWTLDDQGTLTISGTGDMTTYNRSRDFSPWVWNAAIKCVIVKDGVTSLGSCAFLECNNLASISIPSSVTSIGDNVFLGCDNLASISIPSSVTSIGDSAFEDCGKLTGIVIPDKVAGIGNRAFLRCSNLTSVTLPSSVTSIGSTAFYGCSNLTSISIPDKVTSIGDSAFENCGKLTGIVIPDKVTAIMDRTFYNCSNLASITIGDSVTSIGYSAFYRCSNLMSVTLPSSVTSIGQEAFSGCSSLASITIPDSVTSIGLAAFAGCSTLMSFEFPDSVMSIGGLMFDGCTSLTSVTLPGSVTSIEGGTFQKCTSLASLDIPDSVTSIGDSAFSGCTGLTSIEIPDNVTSIGKSAFNGCTGLTSIEIPDNVTSIEYATFYGCTSLTLLDIPDSVTSIGSTAFCGCSNLTSINIPSSVMSIWDMAFQRCSLTSVTIPSSVTYVGYAAFKQSGLTSVIIENSVMSSEMFSGCSSLTSVIIGDSVTSIGSAAFYGCSDLTSINIPSSVTSIGSYAFKNCSKFTSIDIPSSVMSIGDSAFEGCSKLLEISFGGNLSLADAFPSHTFYQTADGQPLDKNTGGNFGGRMFVGNSTDKMVCTDSLSKCHVTYNLNDGTGNTPTQEDVWEGINFTAAGCTATYDACTFGGWSWNGRIYQEGEIVTMGASDITLTAVWIPVYKVTYDVGEGSEPAPTQDPVQEGTEFTVKGYTGSRTGYSFGGWSYNGTTYTEGQEIRMGTTDITLTALWIPVKHSVTYVLNGGSGTAPTQDNVQENQTFKAASYSGTKDTFSFGGWSWKGTIYQPGERITMGTTDIILTAVWIPVKHSVTYDAGEGSEPAPTQDDVQERQMFEVASYSGMRDTFSFGGWTYNGSTYQPGDVIEMGSEDIVLTAIWNPVKHSVTYDVGEGSEPAPTQGDVQERQMFEVASYSGMRDTFSFGGWTYNGSTYQPGERITMGTRDIILTAVWIPVKHSVTYDVGEGSEPAPTQDDVQEKRTFKAASYSGMRDTFSFGGWNDGNTTYQPDQDITMGTSDIILTAVWIPVKHSVTYDTGEGSEPAPTQDDVQEKVAFQVAFYPGTRDTYAFGGWSDGNKMYQPGDMIEMGSEDIVLTAIWNPVKHSVTYDTGEGSEPAPTQDDVQEKQAFEVASYSGTKATFSFGGWTYNGSTYQPGDVIEMGSEDIVLIAIWNPVKHKVTYDVGEGSGTAPIQDDVQEKVAFQAASYTGTRDTYTFGGWSWNDTTYQPGDMIEMGSEDIVLIVIWNPVKHKMTYDIDGGSGTAPIQDDVQEKQKFTVKDYVGTRTGYTFGGWTYDGSTYKAGDMIEMGTSDIVLKAVWSKIFVPMPDDRDDDPVIPVIPDRTSGDGGDDSTSAVIVATGCVVVLLAILSLIGSFRIRR